jgi:CBS domain-containing protein
MSGAKPLRVSDLMTRQVATLQRNDKLSIADQVMQLGRIRHMPVLDEDGQLAGVVSQRDLFRGSLAKAFGYGTSAQKRVLDTITVKEVMATDPITATPEQPLAEAAALMLERKIGCLPVVEDGKLVGILTESDFVGWFARGPRQA